MDRLHCKLKIRLAKEELFFGPGVEALLKLTNEHASLNAACKQMNLSYTKALRMIQGTEKNLGFKVLERKIGGSGGGGSRLTTECIKFLEKYEAFEAELEEKADELFDKHFSEYF